MKAMADDRARPGDRRPKHDDSDLQARRRRLRRALIDDLVRLGRDPDRLQRLSIEVLLDIKAREVRQLMKSPAGSRRR